jgi:hypothetical protein
VKPSDGTESLRGSEMTRCANTGREQWQQKICSITSSARASKVGGIFVRGATRNTAISA